MLPLVAYASTGGLCSPALSLILEPFVYPLVLSMDWCIGT
jgi:hypothetical protein